MTAVISPDIWIDLKPPEWAREEMESIETNGGAILKDPLLLVERPAQVVWIDEI